MYFLFFFILPHVTVPSTASTPSFIPLTTIGRYSISNNVPTAIVATDKNNLFVGGTTSPSHRGQASDLGTPMHSNLSEEDMFLANIRSTGIVLWVIRFGTSHEDRLTSLLLNQDQNAIFVGGSTLGSFSSQTSHGQSDIVIFKFDVSSSRPTPMWDHPLILGTSESESVAALALDPSDPDRIFAVGYTTGPLFPSVPEKNGSDVEACLFSMSASTGTLIAGRQFGTRFADHATGLWVSPEQDGPIFVSAITERVVGQYTFGNFHLYKFSKNLTFLGDILLRTYSREIVSGFDKHPFLSDSLFVSGSSWLEAGRGYDIFVKSVIQPLDSSSIGSTSMLIDDVGKREYTHRLHSSDSANDYAAGMLIHPQSGQLILGANTGGLFVADAKMVGVLSPLIICINPITASVITAVQMPAETSQSWTEITAIAFSSDRQRVYCAFKHFNETSLLINVAVTELELPSECLVRITLPSPEPSPSPHAFAQQAAEEEKPSKQKRNIVIGVMITGIILSLTLVLFAIYRFTRGRKGEKYSNFSRSTFTSAERKPVKPVERIRFVPGPNGTPESSIHLV